MCRLFVKRMPRLHGPLVNLIPRGLLSSQSLQELLILDVLVRVPLECVPLMNPRTQAHLQGRESRCYSIVKSKDTKGSVSICRLDRVMTQCTCIQRPRLIYPSVDA